MENIDLSTAQAVDVQELCSLLGELGYRLVKMPTTPEFDSFLKNEVRKAQIRAEISQLESDVNKPQLVSALKKWRRETARKENVPPYFVLTDRTLLQIAGNEPSNIDELLSIPGVGEVKGDKYCYQIVKLIERVNHELH